MRDSIKTPSLDSPQTEHAKLENNTDELALPEQPYGSDDGQESTLNPAHLHGRQLILTLLGLSLLLFLAAIDTTIVSTSLIAISSQFHSYDRSSWIVSAFTLTYASFIPPWSKLSDIYGRKPVLLAGTIIFVVFSAACAAAQSIQQLIVFRAFQGIGASTIYSLVVTVIMSIVPSEKVPMLSSIISIIFSTAAALGPVVGGVLTQSSNEAQQSGLGWRWIFLINIPIGIIGFVLLLVGFTESRTVVDTKGLSHRARLARVDWAGSLLIILSTVMLLTGIELGSRNLYAKWRSPEVVSLLVLGPVLLAFLPWVESKVKHPVVPNHFYANRTLMALILIAFCAPGFVFLSVAVYLPQEYQLVRQESPLHSGIMILPLACTGVLSFAFTLVCKLSGHTRPVLFFGTCLITLGTGLLGLQSTNVIDQFGFQVILGAGCGAIQPLLAIVGQLSVSSDDLASAMGLINFQRMMGGTIGVAVTSALLRSFVDFTTIQAKLRTQVPDGITSKDSFETVASQLESILIRPAQELGTFSQQEQTIILQGFDRAFRLVWITLAGVAGAAILCCLLLKEYRTEPLLAARRRAADEEK